MCHEDPRKALEGAHTCVFRWLGVSNKRSLMSIGAYVEVTNRIWHGLHSCSGKSKPCLFKLCVSSALFQNSSFKVNTLTLDAKAHDGT